MKKRTGRMIAAAAGILIAAETAAAPLKAQAAAWQQQGEKLYAYDDAGNLLTNTLVPYGGFVYAVGEDGSMQTGWTSLNGANYCFDERGRLLAGGATLDGYEVNELGQCIATIGVAPSQIAMAEPDGADILFYVGDADTWWMSEPVELPAAQELLDGTTGRPLVVAAAKSLLGVPYVWSGASAAGVDCSGLVEYAYDAAFGKWLLHDADLQSKLGKAVAVSALQPGDLCCYDWNRDGTVDHIAIYIGSGKVIEASSSKNVVKVSGLRSGKNLVTCRSLFAD